MNRLKILINRLILVLLVSSYIAQVYATQTIVADPVAYRATKGNATATFLDKDKPKSERIGAYSKLGYPEEGTFIQLVRIGLDKKEDDQIRLLALQRARYDDKYFDAVLSILGDINDGGETLNAGLIDDISRRTTFRHSAELRQRLQQALRNRLTDSSASVRRSAYYALVPTHDVVAIDLLVESLRSNNNIPIPVHNAIELLDVDGSAKHIVTLRPFLNSQDSLVQAQAARALAVDPESREKVIALATSMEVANVVRKNALRALAREDEKFFSYALNLLSNKRETPDIRLTIMNVSVGRMNYHKIPARIQLSFAKAVQKLASEPSIKTLKDEDVNAEARKLFMHMRKRFPAVRKAYGL